MNLATHTREEPFDFVAEAARNLARARAAELTAANCPDYTQGLTAVQLEVLDVTDRRFALLWGRRTGKTHTLPRLLLRSAAEEDTWSVYLTKTRKNAKLLLWRWLKRAAHVLGIGYSTDETNLVMDIAGGGSILLGGADDLAAIERWRQFGWKLAILDEMGVYPDDLLVTLIDDVIAPATADFEDGGTIAFSGTPGYILDGRWYELSGPESKIRVIRADARSNTAKPWIWQNLLKDKEQNGWADDHPTWLREGLGLWVQDASTLVYPYDRERNGCTGLPTHTIAGTPLSTSGWRYCLGVDVGFVDATAFVLVAVHEDDPCEYVVSSESYTEMLPDAVARRIAEYLEQRPWTQVVMDAGGMGKIHAMWASWKDQLPLVPADKRDKPSAIRDGRGALLSGRSKWLDGPQNAPIRAEANHLGWGKDKLHHADGQADHCLDAWLYARRHLRHFTAEPELGPPKPPTRLLEEKLVRQREKAVMGNGRPWWDH